MDYLASRILSSRITGYYPQLTGGFVGGGETYTSAEAYLVYSTASPADIWNQKRDLVWEVEIIMWMHYIYIYIYICVCVCVCVCVKKLSEN